MIEADNIWYHMTFESVMRDLWNMWTEGIQEMENTHMHCTNNDKNNYEMCSVSQNKNEAFMEGKESKKQESQDKSKHDAVDKMEVELRTIRSKSMTKNK